MFFGGGHLGFPIGIKNRNFIEDLQMISHVICFNMVPWVQKRRKGYKDIRG
jgi:hypothetical protein